MSALGSRSSSSVCWNASGWDRGDFMVLFNFFFLFYYLQNCCLIYTFCQHFIIVVISSLCMHLCAPGSCVMLCALDFLFAKVWRASFTSEKKKHYEALLQSLELTIHFTGLYGLYQVYIASVLSISQFVSLSRNRSWTQGNNLFKEGI